MAKADVIICGHSHQPFAREVDGVWFINTGSVGRPDDGDPRACYAILQIDSKQIQVRHYRVEYDVERAVAAIREHELPEPFAQMTLEGHSLDAVLQGAEK
jgi:diadenosine tetraphosphatase ApaH/serine/threonine PP2A family protein phosphatase